MMVRRVLLIALVGVSLVSAACGSDDSSPESSKTAAGTTDSAGPTSQIPAIPEIPGRTEGERERGSGGSGSSGKNNGSSGSDGSSGKDRSRGKNGSQPGFSAPGTSPGPAGGASPNESGDAPPLAKSDSAAYRLAKEICANVTLEGIALNLRINLGKRDPEFVAKAFSQRYPKDHRDAAHRGCLAGFRNPVKSP